MSKTFKLWNGRPTAEVEASASIDNNYSDTQAKITVKASGRLPYANAYVYSSGVVVKATCNGVAKDKVTLFGNLKSYFYNSNGWTSLTFDFIVDKSSAAWAAGWKVDFYSYVDGTQLGNGPAATISGTKNVAAITLYAPNEPSNLTATRVSDKKISLAFDPPETDATHPCTRIYIERSVDGGARTELGYVSGTTKSYDDTTTSPNHKYKYYIRAYNSAGYSEYAESNICYTTPSAPTKVEATRMAETTVSIKVTNPSNLLATVELQRSDDKETWETVASAAGYGKLGFTDEPGGGTFYYRARLTRGDLTGPWSAVSDPVVTICAPNPPTLVSPVSGSVEWYGAGNVLTIPIQWRHETIDGSAQTAAQIQPSMRTADGTFLLDAIDIEGDANTYELPNEFELGTTLYVKVRTKGAHEDWSDWSTSRYLMVKKPPYYYFELPSDNVVENTPIDIKVVSEDEEGSFVSGLFSIAYTEFDTGTDDTEWKVLYSREINSVEELEFALLASEFLPTNGLNYLFKFEGLSSTGLRSTAEIKMLVDFVEPSPGELLIEPDPETGYVVITAYETTDAELEPIVSMSLYRVLNGTRTLLGDHLTSGAAIIDKEAPLNTDYSYEVVSFADSGAFTSVEFATVLNTGYFFFYWGEQIARAKWDPKETIKLSNPSKQRVYYLDRPDPVSYNGKNREDSRTASGVVETRDDARQFQRLNDDGGRCLYKSLEGDVLYCDAEVNLNPALAIPSYWGEVSVALVKIDNTGTNNVTPIPNQLSAEQSVIFKKYLAANLEEILEELLRYGS